MAPTVIASIPEAPKHLPAEIAAQWQAAYAKKLAQAKLDTPDNERAQRIAALKAANGMLAVPAPESAADIEALADWQVMTRETRVINGVETKVCVTADGRKYRYPVAPARAARVKSSTSSIAPAQ